MFSNHGEQEIFLVPRLRKPVRLLANENFPREAVEALRNDGHDVAWVRTECSGISDRAVLGKAQQDKKRHLPSKFSFSNASSIVPGLKGHPYHLVRAVPPLTPPKETEQYL